MPNVTMPPSIGSEPDSSSWSTTSCAPSIDIDREADPDAARIVVGGELWSLIDGSTPSRRLAEPRTLGHVLTLIEQI